MSPRRAISPVFVALSVLLLSTPTLAQWRSSYDRAKSLQAQGKLAEAANEYRRAANLAGNELGSDSQTYAVIAQRIGHIESDLGNYREAQKWLIAGYRAAVASEGPLSSDAANSLNSLGVLCNRMSEYAQGEQFLIKAAEAYTANHDLDSTAMALANLGDNLRMQGQYAKAEANYLKALKWYRGRGASEGIALLGLGVDYLETGRIPEAAATLERNLALQEKFAPRTFGHANALNNLGMVRARQGDSAAALKLFQQQLEILKEVFGEDHVEVGNAYRNAGVALISMNRAAEALAMYDLALKNHLKSVGPDHELIGWDRLNLAGAQLKIGQLREAEANIEDGTRILNRTLGPDHPEMATALKGLADLYLKKNDGEKALPLAERVASIREKVSGAGDPETINAWMDVAIVHYNLGNYEQSDEYYQKVKEAAQKSLPAQHPIWANLELNLGNLRMYQKKLDEAATHLENAIERYTAQVGPDAEPTTTALLNLAMVQRLQNRWTQAADTCDASRRAERRFLTTFLAALAEPEQLAYLGDNYRQHLSQALSLGVARPDDADLANRSAEWLLNGKSMAQEVLTERARLLRDSPDSVIARAATELMAVRRELAELSRAVPDTDLDNWKIRLEQLADRERLLAKQVGKALGDTERNRWVTLDSVRKAIPADNVLIELARIELWDPKTFLTSFDSNYVAWIIPPAGDEPVQIVDLGPAKVVDEAVLEARQAIQDGRKLVADKGEAEADKLTRPALEKLAKLIFAPLEKRLASRKRWTLSPDGALWLVPWAVLPTAKGNYAVEDYILGYLVTGRDLVEAVPKQLSGNPAIVLANPNYDSTKEPANSAGSRVVSRSPIGLRGGFTPLPGTAEEIRLITPSLTAYIKQQPETFTGDDAREEVYQSAYQPRVLVLATHGYFSELKRPTDPKVRILSAFENPLLRCGLGLAGANAKVHAGADGVLTGLEVVDGDLRGTELVVLSACQTGLGDVNTGEGVAGLRQAFQLAGAMTVLATLWSIPDRDTALLMQAFWENLSAGQDKTSALASAQRTMISNRRKKSQGAHPFYWAAFTATGPWQSLTVGPVHERPARTTPAAQVVVTSTNAEIMDGPKSLAKVSQGDRLTVVEQKGEWYLVTLPSDSSRTGWILARHAELVK